MINFLGIKVTVDTTEIKTFVQGCEEIANEIKAYGESKADEVLNDIKIEIFSRKNKAKLETNIKIAELSRAIQETIAAI